MRSKTVINYFAYFFLFSCNNNAVIKNEKIDKFISKYENVKFEELKDISISQRSKSAGGTVYVIGKDKGNLPVYFVTFDPEKRKITNVNKENLLRAKVNDYLSMNEIIIAINTITKNDFYFLAVDSFQNVYINPFRANEPPFLLRLKTFTGDSVIKKGYVYELYRKDWYLNRTRRKG